MNLQRYPSKQVTAREAHYVTQKTDDKKLRSLVDSRLEVTLNSQNLIRYWRASARVSEYN